MRSWRLCGTETEIKKIYISISLYSFQWIFVFLLSPHCQCFYTHNCQSKALFWLQLQLSKFKQLSVLNQAFFFQAVCFLWSFQKCAVPILFPPQTHFTNASSDAVSASYLFFFCFFSPPAPLFPHYLLLPPSSIKSQPGQAKMNEEVWVEKGGWGNSKHRLYNIRTLVESLQWHISMALTKCFRLPRRAAGQKQWSEKYAQTGVWLRNKHVATNNCLKKFTGINCTSWNSSWIKRREVSLNMQWARRWDTSEYKQISSKA